MTSINAPGTADDATFTLDAIGRFATRSVAGTLDSTYGYLADTETVVALVGATTRVSAIGPDGSRVATKDASTTAYLLPDLHGNVIGAEASASTTIVNAIRYDGYGQTAGTPYTATGNVAMDVKYQGRLDISASDEPLYDMSARFYAPAQGTFTQLDSVMGGAQNPMSMNRFLYAEANPTTLIDPTGHRAVLDYGSSVCTNLTGAGCTTAAPKPTSTSRSYNGARDRDNKVTGGATIPAGPRLSVGKVTDDATAPWFSIESEYQADVKDYARQHAQDAQEESDIAMDVGGLLGPVGPAFDLAHAVNYAGRGQWGDAGISVFFAVPLLGDVGAWVAKGEKITKASSKLDEVSKLAFKAADKAGSYAIKPYHLAGSGGEEFTKFVSGADGNAAIVEALTSQNAMILRNTYDRPGYIIITDLGRAVGTNGETAVKVVITESGSIKTAFPYWPLVQ